MTEIKVIQTSASLNTNSASNSDDLSLTVLVDKQPTAHLFISGYMNMTNEIKADSIKTFADFQTANIQRLSEAIKDKTPQQALEYLNEIQEAFNYEIWLNKEKSWAAETLKGLIKKSVETEKHKILPEYNPANLSKVSRAKSPKIKTVGKTKEDSSIALFKALGISEADAKIAIEEMRADSFKKGLANNNPKVEEPKYKECPKCSALNPLEFGDCMICGTNVRECEFCSNFTTSKDSKVCKGHDSKGNVIESK